MWIIGLFRVGRCRKNKNRVIDVVPAGFRETKRQKDIEKLTAQGHVPYYHEIDALKAAGKEPTPEEMIASDRLISGYHRLIFRAPN